MAGIKLNLSQRESIGKCGDTFCGLVEVNWTMQRQNRTVDPNSSWDQIQIDPIL